MAGSPDDPITIDVMTQPSISERLRIAGKNNPLVKELRRAFHRGELSGEGDCAIEGVRIVEEAIRSGLKFRAVFFSQSAETRSNRVLPQIGSHVETLVLADALFSAAVPSETPQGVAALVRMPQHDLEEILRVAKDAVSSDKDSEQIRSSKSARRGTRPDTGRLFVTVVGLQDPGNLGTLIRSAEAFGAAGVILAGPNVSPFNSKVVRASAGSIFRVPVVRADIAAVLAQVRKNGVRTIATSSHKGTALHQAKLSGPVAIFIGSEGGGIPRELLGEMDEVVVIPHSERVESLNAGVAASIILYEAARQRNVQ
ncbi:MAG TPA: RNA methyltransferase [Terriglobales bacterium]|nr:RNA methyltransferase [Terriglobales bacterium]